METTQLIELEQAKQLTGEESGCGVYFLWKGDDLLYVGGSRAVGNRMTMHSFAKGSPPWCESYGVKVPYDRVTILACKPEDMRNMERAYIEKFSPPFNKQGKK